MLFSRRQANELKTVALLVNFGGPRTLDEVPLFLRNLTGRDLPPPVQEAVVKRYRAIGGGSPLAAITAEQAELLAAETGAMFPIKAAFRYSRPSIEEMINECYTTAVERIAFLIMAPYYTSRTVGSYMNAAQTYLSLLPYTPRIVFIHSWYSERLFIESWLSRIADERHGRNDFYLFTAHSLPESARGEPYRTQIAETVEAIASGLGLSHYALAWQSIPEKAEEPWMGPTVEAVMDGVSGKVDCVVEVPIGFVSDHLETLYDIDIVHRAYAAGKGLVFSRVPSLNTYPPFISALAAILEKGLREAS